MIIAIIVILLSLLLLFLYSACKVSGDISRLEEQEEIIKNKSR